MLHTWIQFLSVFFKDEEGASAVEYGLILGLIAVALVIVLGFLGGGLGNLFDTICDAVVTGGCA